MKKIRKLIVIFSLIVCLGMCGAGGIVLSGLGSPELAENGGGNSESEEFKPADPGDIKIPETTSNASGNWNSYKASGFAGGTGSSSDPYRIETAAQLAYYCLSFTGNSYVKLTKPIDLSAHYWNAPSVSKSACYFDGGGHTIYGFISTQAYSLFDRSYSDINLHDLLIHVDISGNRINNLPVGALFRSIDSDNGTCQIKNVGVYGSINVSSSSTGGLIGKVDRGISIYNCFNKANIISSGYAGGIVGDYQANTEYTLNNDIYNCYNTGDINASSCAGGICARTGHADIKYCYNTGKITSSAGNSYAGGIVGVDNSQDDSGEDYNYADPGTSIYSCFNDGQVYYGIIADVYFIRWCTISDVAINGKNSSAYNGGGQVSGFTIDYSNKYNYDEPKSTEFYLYYHSGKTYWSLSDNIFDDTWFVGSNLLFPVHNWYLACATTIYLDKNGGSGGTYGLYSLYRIGVFEDQALSKSTTEITPPSRSGYYFDGYVSWDEVDATDGDSDGIWIDNDGYVTSSCYLSNLLVPGSTIYLEAQWNKTNIRTITLNQNGGNSGSSYIYYWNGAWYEDRECDSEIEYIPTRPEKKWYKFDGYYSSSTSTTQYADANGKITRSSVSGNETWYAHWSKDASQALTITLTDHGGSGGKGKIYFWNTSYYSDAACSSVITTVTKPSKTGYVFAGYYSAASGGTQNVDGTGKITKTSVSVNEEWHAHWDADYNHIYITIKSKGFTDATFSASATGGTVTVTGYTDSNGTATSKTTQVTASTGDVQCMVGFGVTVSAAAKSGYTLVYLGTDANWTTSKEISTSNWTDANTSKGNKNVYAYFIQEPGNKVKYDSVKKYYYFENGEFPQAYVGDDTNKTLQSASLGTANYTISTAWGNIPVYTYNSHKYAMLTATSAQTIKTSKGTLTTAKDGKYFFEVQPIRWMVKSSDWTADYAYNSNFVGVTADILLFSSVNTSNLNYNKDFSTTTLQSTLNGIITNVNLNDFAASVSYKAEYFNNTSTTLVKESATSVTGKMRVVSTSDLEAVGSWQATASDLALFMYSSKMGANSDTAGNLSYWTRNLGTYLNNGTIVTATGNTKNNHLTEFNGVRFAITFTSGGRFGI